MHALLTTLLSLALAAAGTDQGPAPAARPVNPQVTGIKAAYRNGQTFVTWKDAAEGEAGAAFRYSLYHSDKPITQDNLAAAELCYKGVLNNSAKQFGHAFSMKDRLDPAKPTAIIEEGGQPLPMWSGLGVHTVARDGKSYYAVVATDEKGDPLSKVVPGESATAAAVDEKVAPVQPIKIGDSKTRGAYARIMSITGAKNLPLLVSLHASSGGGGAAGDHGDYYLYFATPEMGYRDGLPGVFSVEERRPPAEAKGADDCLVLQSRDAIVSPNGKGAMETYWFGYYCVPQWAKDPTPRAYPFTENRMMWIIDWVMKKYAADPNRVYASGQSMGGWGSATFAFRHAELFAGIFPTLPRTRQVDSRVPSLIGPVKPGAPAMMPDGKTSYNDRMDMVKFAAEHHEDLPFMAWSIGRNDGFASWKQEVDMVTALTAAHHGFAMAWNDGGHSEGSQPMAKVAKYFSREKFAMNQSYPAFGNSTLDNDMGSGELVADPQTKGKQTLKDGEPEGSINLGFIWSDVIDEPNKWSVKVSNDLAKKDMGVDVTPRRCQKFKLKAGEKVKWTDSAGGSGELAADEWGLVTVPRMKIKLGQATVVTIAR